MPSLRDCRRPRWVRALDLASVLAFVATAGLFAARLGPPPPSWWPLLIPALLAGVAAADLASGLVHWFCDTFFRPETPGLGPLLIAPFREHHVDPLAITRHGPLEVTGNNALLGTVLLATALPVAERFGQSLGASLFVAFWTAGVAAGVATNQIHRWAHLPRPPRVVAWLQRAGVLLPPEAHALHHGELHRGAYCVTSGWCNPLLDRSGILPALEALVARWRRGRGRR